MSENFETLQQIFRDVLDDDGLSITETFSTADCPDWDSVATIQIVLAVEAEFGVKFTTNEVANLKSVADILKKIDNL